MKRLVVCCDGTWNKPDAKSVTNVEKIARTVQSDPARSGGVSQLVYYISGVGAGSYAADRILGGAFGFGLWHNVIASYRFLAQNYEPDDQIFIFGFSRGAYTARSVAGMVAKVGLLTKLSLVEERLPAAVHMYQGKAMAEGAFGASVEEFKHDHCHNAKVTFLGVFDTVGALGVPGINATIPRFHDVQLSPSVFRARHALSIDDPRLKFAPTLWEVPADPDRRAPQGDAAAKDRVKQVWFEGAHSDIGGGLAETGLSDTTLLWMAKEAHEVGLVFDADLLDHYVNSGSDPIRHNPLNAMYRVDNLFLKTKSALGGGAKESPFSGGLRRLTNDKALSLGIANSVVNHFQAGGYAPANVQALAEATDGFSRFHVETVEAMPEAGVDLSPLGRPVPAGGGPAL